MEQKKIEEKLRVFVENKFGQKNRKFVLNVYNDKKNNKKKLVVGVLEKKKNKRDDEYFTQKDGVL